MSRSICVVVAFGLVLLAAGPAEASPARTGVSTTGQPGMPRTLSAVPAIRGGWHLVTTATYGWEGDVLAEGDARHLAGARFALGYSPWSFLTISLDARTGLEGYVWPEGNQDTLVLGVMGDPRLALRTGFALGAGFSLGAMAAVLFPSGWGSFNPSGSAISPTFAAMISFAPDRVPLGIHLEIAYRHDRSGELFGDREGLSRQHLLLAGVSSAYHHLELDLGVEYRIGPVAPFVELGADLPLGADGVETFLMLGFGARLWLGPADAVQIHLGLDLRVTPAAEVPEPAAGVYPYEPPLLSVSLGVAFRLPVARAEGAAEPREPGEGGEPDDRGAAGETGAPEAPERGRIVGQVRCAGGPCGLSVRVGIAGTGGSSLAPDDRTGAFRSGALAPGTYRVTASAQGYVDSTQEVVVEPGGAAAVSFDLAAAQVVEPTRIQGVVRDFNGNPVAATVIIPVLGREIQADEQGRFEIDVEPGRHEVIVSAPGYATQHSRIDVRAHETVVMNVELRRR